MLEESVKEYNGQGCSELQEYSVVIYFNPSHTPQHMSSTPKPLVLLIALLMVTWVPTVMATDSDGDGVMILLMISLMIHVQTPILMEMECQIQSVVLAVLEP